MRVTLPDGSPLELQEGATGADAAAAIGPGLARAALAVKQNGDLRDLDRPLVPDEPVEIVTEKSGQDALDLIRHDAAHVLATAVLELYPGVKISIGPAIENGFYYDFEFSEGVVVSDADFEAIEAKMREHIAADETFTREDVSVAEALERFRAEGQDYKVELIEDLIRDEGVQTVSLYTNGPFTDLCRGPHGPTTKRIGAIKLQSVAGAYWRGDANRQMLTRLYGTAFFKQSELDAFLEQLELARARDHRKLGRELGLFTFSPLSPGSTFWLPKGTAVFNALVALNRRMQQERDYVEVKTPLLYDVDTWVTSGHWEKFRDDMFLVPYGERTLGLKPMNCPGHMLLFGSALRSYRDLPVRYAEASTLHRNERAGTLHGLLRVQHVTQDDAHMFVTPDQIEEEIFGCLDYAMYLYDLFGVEARFELSTRPENKLGTDEEWDFTEGALRSALERRGIEYTVNEGDGAFYGPKIDLHMTDVLGRSWQMGTIQLDSQMPARFGLSYMGEDNAEHTPYVIHRALFGSLERFIGILIEHYAGAFPFWLAPVQVRVIPVGEGHRAAANELAGKLDGYRVEVDERDETVGKRIRDAEVEKIPIAIVYGDKESDESLAVRERGGGQSTMTLDELLTYLATL
jgi:threonyl-tRNA synthetase